MNISELFDLTTWIDAEISGGNIVEKYADLHQALVRYSQPNQRGTSFENERDDLLEAVRSVTLQSLTKDQLKFLETIEIAPAIGEVGASYIEDTLYRNVIDVATSADKFQETVNELNRGLERSQSIQSGLAECVPDEPYEADGEVLMRVTFTRDASMSHVGDFKNWGRAWYDIGRGIAMAHGTAPDEVKIVGATKGSIVLELSLLTEIAATTGGIILFGLKVAEKVIDLKLKAEEFRGMKLKNNQIASDIEKEAEEARIAGVTEITVKTAKKLKITKSKDGDKYVALEKSVKTLINFVEKGGDIDFVMPEEKLEEGEELSEKNIELRNTFEEIRTLENKIALLEYEED